VQEMTEADFVAVDILHFDGRPPGLSVQRTTTLPMSHRGVVVKCPTNVGGSHSENNMKGRS